MLKSIQATLILLLIFSVQASAQEAIAISDLIKDEDELSARDISRINETIIISDTLVGWNSNWLGNINGGQAAYNNWSQGGVNTITLTASTVLDVYYRKDRFGYGFSTNLKYGKARIDEEGTRKTDDRIALNNKFSYQFTNTNWNAFANINFSTQFDQGIDYNVEDDEDPVLLSEFFSPAYFTQIAGIGFTPTSYFAVETGLAMKETFVMRSTLLERYGLPPGDNLRFEPGYSVAIGFEKDIFKNLRLTSSVETFTNMQRHVDRTDVAFTNELRGKINDFLNMSFQFVSVYDEDFSRKTQFKQVLSAGLSVSIL
jgi:hypothetical protein